MVRGRPVIASLPVTRQHVSHQPVSHQPVSAMRLVALIGLWWCRLVSTQSWVDLLTRQENVVEAGDNMTLTVDLSAADKLSMKNELVIRIFNAHDRQVICESYLTAHIASGTFKCSFNAELVRFRHGPNYFEMELVSARTGKRYARQVIPTIYHVDSAVYGDFRGFVLTAANVTAYTRTVLWAAGGSVVVKWALDAALDAVTTSRPNYRPPRPPPRRPLRRIARTTIYGAHSQRRTTTPARPAPAAKRGGTRRRVTRSTGTGGSFSVSDRLVALWPHNWKLPLPNISLLYVSAEQMAMITSAIKYGVGGCLALLLLAPTLTAGGAVLGQAIPQSLSAAGRIVGAIVAPVVTLTSKLLPRQRYITIDGYKVPLDSVSYRAPASPSPAPLAAAAASAGGSGGSIYSRWVRAQDAKKKKTRKIAIVSAPSSPPPPRRRSKPSGWLADAPPLVKPRCPLRQIVDFPIRSDNL